MAKITPEILTGELKAICGENLRSVVLYGSAAAGDSVKTSDHNVLVVLERLETEDLAALAGLSARWCKEGNHAPLLFTRKGLARSADVFAVEFADIKQTHKTLHGEDYFAAMEIDHAHLRLELERELKSKLLLLRENFLAAKSSRKELDRLMVSSVSSFLTLFKAALRLYGEVPPVKKMDALPMLSKHVKLDEEAFSLVWGLKEGRKIPDAASPQVFMRYLKTVQDTTDAVDLWIQNSEKGQEKRAVPTN
jgi:predicted nucleotidyltransferase